MKVLIAPQAFKGTLSPFEAADAIEKGVKCVFPKAKIDKIPVADGGDGTLDVLMDLQGSTRKRSTVTGPLGEPITCEWGIMPDGITAVIELAKVCGLVMIPHEKRNPLITTTFGIGELIQIGLNQGIQNFLIAVGGSATHDVGTGIAQALGVRLLDREGNEIPIGGGSLSQLAHIDVSNQIPVHIVVATDVSNTLSEAAKIYAPQKGASPAMVKELEEGTEHFAAITKRDLGISIDALPGGGAAGGVSAGLHAFFNASLVSGVDFILDKLNFQEHLEGTDLVITGEGCLDKQTLFDKAPIGVARLAREKGVPVLAIVGKVREGYQEVHQHGIDAVIPTSFHPNEDISADPSLPVTDATEQALRCLKIRLN